MIEHSAKTIELENNVNIYTETFGAPTGIPLLLLHGAGNSMLNWSDGLCEKLSNEGFYVVRMDSRDAGRSTKFPLGNPDYGLMDLVQDVARVLDHLNIKKAIVAGVSQGAAVTQLLAIHYPVRVSSICLISATPGGPGHDASDLPGMTKEIAAVFSDPKPSEPNWRNKQEVVDYLVEAERPFGGTAFDEALTRQMATSTYDLVPELAYQLTNPYAISAGESWRGRLKEITVPALIVHGSEDPLFPLEHGKALSREIPNAALLVIKGMGHANIPKSAWNVLIEAIKKLAKS